MPAKRVGPRTLVYLIYTRYSVTVRVWIIRITDTHTTAYLKHLVTLLRAGSVQCADTIMSARVKCMKSF
jgi:hypothetical protein